jgi:isoamylase
LFRALVPICLLLLACEPGNGARLYHTEQKAPSLGAAEIEALDTLGPTLIDKGVNFSVYSERAERIELLLFDDPESNEPTRQFPMHRFGDVWNLHVEGIGLGQHYGYIAFGPNWVYDPAWYPGAIDGFKSDVDAEGNRFNPNKLLFDPYGKALHRDHDWSKGNLASGPRRTDVTYAAAAKSVVVQSKYVWSAAEDAWRQKRQDANWVGHRWNDLIMYEVHAKGFTASTASAVAHPGTFLGVAEKADYLKALGINAVELMPVFEKPLDGGYWGYATLSFFAPELTYASRRSLHEVIDEFKAMVDALHQRGIEVILDVVYNHTGEGGFWRNKLQFDFSPDRSLDAQVVNYDAKEVTGLYSYRGLDNAAWYALSDDKQSYINNTGVGNETRSAHRPMRRLILDSLRYWATEMHVDGFRFDLAPIHGEKDLQHYIWEDPKNTVLQEIIDDPVLKQHNVRIIAEPWAAGGYDLAQSFNGPGNNDFQNGYGTRLGLFPAETERPGVGWYEWNGRFRDWWRAFVNNDGWNLNSTEVKNGGFFLTGSHDWYQWNGRGPHTSVNFVTVHDGFTMYDLFSYNLKQNKCGPLNPVCCDEPLSPFCEFDSGESNNRSRDWGQANEHVKRQQMRNLFVALMVSHGTPMLYGGDEWMRTQLGNNNAYTTRGDNEFNWFDWGTWEANDERHRMFDFVSQLTRFRKEHGDALAPAEWGKGAPFAWKSPANDDNVNWNGKALMIHYWDATQGPELAILINMEAGQTDFTLPAGRPWKRLLDTQSYFDLPATLTSLGKPQRKSANIELDSPTPVPGAVYGVPGRSIVVLEAR